ncbi:MAG: hypothetical protein ACP5RW_00100 [bacterium]
MKLDSSAIEFIKRFEISQTWWNDTLDDPVDLNNETLPVRVNQDVELEGKNWRPIKIDRKVVIDKVALVDGVRRTDTHLMIGNSGRSALLGEFVVGAFDLSKGKVMERNQAECIIVFPPGITVNSPLLLGKARYEPVNAVETGDEGIYRMFLQKMREREKETALKLSMMGYTVIADGPLQVPFSKTGVTLGFVKSTRRYYLTGRCWETLVSLRRGERTPVFLIETSEDLPLKYSWYLRLKDPQYFEHQFLGLVRLEAPSNLTLEEVIDLAQFSGYLLPTLASSNTLSSRAPENLAPLESLERRLRAMFHPLDHIRVTLRRLIAEAHKGGQRWQ